jgi:hypothetical protein
VNEITQPDGERVFDLDTFDRVTTNLGFDTDAKRQKALGMSNVMSRIRAGQTKPGQKFINRLPRLGITYDMVFPLRVKQEV